MSKVSIPISEEWANLLNVRVVKFYGISALNGFLYVEINFSRCENEIGALGSNSERNCVSLHANPIDQSATPVEYAKG